MLLAHGVSHGITRVYRVVESIGIMIYEREDDKTNQSTKEALLL